MQIFDAHFHIIDGRFPLIPNQGYMPPFFTSRDYLQRTQNYQLVGGAVVSGSFQGFDQQYLIQALKELGEGFVGVTQLPVTTTDTEILQLHQQGIRAVRFNIQRGGSEDLQHLENMAKRIYELAGWHVELYVDSSKLEELFSILIKLPAVSIDHLGLTKAGFNILLKLAEQDIKIKATGFGRVDFDVKSALKALVQANPKALMFGTDLPSTRAPRPYADSDIALLQDAIPDYAQQVLAENALEFYRF